MAWPIGVAPMKLYLSGPKVQESMHTTYKGPWVECAGRVYEEIITDPSPPSIFQFTALLAKTSVVVYAGDRDLLCNYVGLQAAFDQFGVVMGPELDGRRGGVMGNLSFHVIVNASHMVLNLLI